MKAVIQDTYGSADVLEFRDIDTPGIARDEVLIRVHAAGVSRGVWHMMTGLPYAIRLAGYGLRAPRTAVPGADLAGVVEAAGQDVTRFQPGDEVFGIGTGAFADFARAPESKLALKPANLSFEQAAVVGVSGLTALQGLRDRGRVGPGQTVLITGASGGVGTFAVQLAKALGAEVTGVCSTTKTGLVRSIGANYVIDYTRADFADRDAALRRDPRHRRERVAVTPAAGTDPQGDTRHRRGREGWPVARGQRSPAAGTPAVPVRFSAADHVRLLGE